MQETQETQIQSLGWEDLLKKEMATFSSILAWRIPWTEEPGGLQFMGSHRIEHTCTIEHTWTYTHIDVSIRSQFIDFFLFQFIWSKMTAADTLHKAAFDFKTDKSFPHLMSAVKYKLKQWYTTSHLLEWPKSKSLTTPTADKDVEQRELSLIIGGSANWSSHFGGHFGRFSQN